VDDQKITALKIKCILLFNLAEVFLLISKSIFKKELGRITVPYISEIRPNRETSPNINSNSGVFSFPSVALAAIVLALSLIFPLPLYPVFS
jgi:hypothetical protein